MPVIILAEKLWSAHAHWSPMELRHMTKRKKRVPSWAPRPRRESKKWFADRVRDLLVKEHHAAWLTFATLAFELREPHDSAFLRAAHDRRMAARQALAWRDAAVRRI
jgi:hypothetical protein